MAQDYPESQFIGVDLSSLQISEGQHTVDSLGLSNIRLIHASILDLDADLGEFDFILCHGVYSWVPPEVQAAILSMGKKRLTPHGLMYVSYNTYPGWRMRGVVREMMQHHVAKFSSPHDQIRQARHLMEWLAASADHQMESFGKLLHEEAEMLKGVDDSYLFHEHLEANNSPVYFHEFVNRLTTAGLGYVGDSNVETMLTDEFDEATRDALADATFLEQEQYMDFLRGRMFRRSILCNSAVNVSRQVSPHCLLGMHLRLSEPMIASGDLEAGEVSFAGESKRVSSRNSTTRRMLQILVESFPNWTATDGLVAEVVEFSKGSVTPNHCLYELTRLVCRGFILASVTPPTFASHISSHPMTTGLVRWQALRGDALVSSRLHESVSVSKDDCLLLSKLDGNTSIERLLEQSPDTLDPRTWLMERLAYYCRYALLIG